MGNFYYNSDKKKHNVVAEQKTEPGPEPEQNGITKDEITSF